VAHVAIHIEGGLISGDLLERIAATPESVEGQRPGEFGGEGRLSDDIQSAFSDATTYWKAFQTRLHRGKESTTTITRDWMRLLLVEELDYDLRFQRAALEAGGSAYPISHCIGDDENKSPVHIVAVGQELDKRGETKLSPHAMVQDYLNRSDALWGIVTDGRRLRLLRNTARFSRPSYIEFDLDAMMTGGLYSEFVLLYRLVHASRLPRSVGDAHECLLERYHQQGIEEGGRVREKLRDGVKEALEILGTGFLAHPNSTALRERFTAKWIDDLDYYRQLLRLIYRLLFLMVAEERRLLFVPSREEAARQEIYTRWYSVARLRERADARLFDDGESDLWEGLKQTFRLFEEANTASELGLTALDGELFGRLACVDLIDTMDVPGPRLRNDKLLSAIWRLSTFEDSDGRRGRRGPRRRVNFAGLDVEEFGSVYEALLDHHPQVTIEGERSRFELVAGTERKSTGSYYTPPELVRELIKSALEPVVADRLSKVGTREDEERALLSLKVCDPASGSGHFVLAAARRIGRELARVRSGEAEPNPEDYRRAVRDVIRRCVYAVDKNPLAVDLCKVALWIEGHASGLPLSFLDNHVKCGDSLVGILDLGVLEAGVPNGAYTAVTGDDQKVAGAIKKANKAEMSETSLFRHTIKDDIGRIAGAFAAIADLPETTPDEVHAKEQRYADLRRSRDWERAKAACDLWSAAFFAPLTVDGKTAVPTTRHVWDAISGRLSQGRVASLTAALAIEQRFFHWPLELPEVFTGGSSESGFDVMLGNPPWERIKLQEKEFFTTRDPEIANAPNKAARDRLIKALNVEAAPPEKRALGREWDEAKHKAECEGIFIREGGRYPLTAVGDINTYSIFAETFLRGVRATGRAGFIVPTGIIVDAQTSAFAAHIVECRRLVQAVSFDNQLGIFPAIHRDTPFCLMTIGRNESDPIFAHYILRTSDLSETERLFSLTADEIAAINPNTRTIPVFRSRADAELTKKFYKTAPVLASELPEGNLRGWRPRFMGMFHMAQDSALFRTAAELEKAGATRNGQTWREAGGDEWWPLYEGKMIDNFDHRAGTFEKFHSRPPKGASLPAPTLEQLVDPAYEPTPWYWTSKSEVLRRLANRKWQRKWLVVWRFSTNPTNVRTVIASLIPQAAAAHILPIMLPGADDAKLVCLLLGMLCSLPLDYVVRQKMARQGLDVFIVKQLPVIDPSAFSGADLDFAATRVLELTYTAEDMRPFAEDLGYDGPPFQWDPDRRALLRAELDAYCAYLYGLTRRELEYILNPKAVMREVSVV
jgi:hypothetical protein